MPRLARIVLSGFAHHVTQRGNNRQDVFFVEEDRKIYLEILQRQAARYGAEVAGYCLMTNHVHLILTPHNDEALAKAIGRTHFIYTQYINRLHKRSGHLWQNRFYSCPLDNRHFLEAMRYIECNPVRAGIVRKPWRYPFSSAAAHVGEPETTGLLNMRYWQKQTQTLDWRQCLLKRLPKENLNRIRRQTHTGRPLATDSLLSKLEKNSTDASAHNPSADPKPNGINR